MVRRLLRALRAGDVPRALRVRAGQWPRADDPQAGDDLSAHLRARAAWTPNYRSRWQERCYIGNGLTEQADDRIVVRRQKRRDMPWGAELSDALAALHTLPLNEGWAAYWQEHRLLRLSAA